MSDPLILATPVGPAVLRRSARATLAISVLPDGQLELAAPQEAPESAILAKLDKRRHWIRRQRLAFAEMHRDWAPVRYESGATHRYLGRQYRLKVQVGEPVGVKLVGAYFHVLARTASGDEARCLLDDWLRQKAREQFLARLAKWEPWCRRRALPAPRLQLRVMPKRWGSAQRDGRIALNPNLVQAPSICIDYVIAHEVCHLQHPGHDRPFFRQLERMFPNWQQAKMRLERLGLV